MNGKYQCSFCRIDRGCGVHTDGKFYCLICARYTEEGKKIYGEEFVCSRKGCVQDFEELKKCSSCQRECCSQFCFERPKLNLNPYLYKVPYKGVPFCEYCTKTCWDCRENVCFACCDILQGAKDLISINQPNVVKEEKISEGPIKFIYDKNEICIHNKESLYCLDCVLDKEYSRKKKNR